MEQTLQVAILKIDETDLINKNMLPQVKQFFMFYFVDLTTVYNLAEIEPSYELQPLYGEAVLEEGYSYEDDDIAELENNVHEDYCYYHCRVVDSWIKSEDKRVVKLIEWHNYGDKKEALESLFEHYKCNRL